MTIVRTGGAVLLGALLCLAFSTNAFGQTTMPTTADAVAIISTATAPAATAAPAIDTGSVAWLLTSAAFVLFMVPGLAMFYGGMVRAKNVLNTFFGCMACIGLVGFLWLAFGYAISFNVVPAGEIGRAHV